MSTTAEEREQLRWSLLRFLDANNTRWGLSAGVLTQMARAEGRPGLESRVVEAELRYLEDKGLVAPAGRVVSPELGAWRITAAGRDEYAQMSGT